MISPQMGRAALRIIVFLVVTALIVLPFVKPGSAEFVVTVVTLALGMGCGVVLFVVVRRQSR